MRNRDKVDRKGHCDRDANDSMKTLVAQSHDFDAVTEPLEASASAVPVPDPQFHTPPQTMVVIQAFWHLLQKVFRYSVSAAKLAA